MNIIIKTLRSLLIRQDQLMKSLEQTDEALEIAKYWKARYENTLEVAQDYQRLAHELKTEVEQLRDSQLQPSIN